MFLYSYTGCIFFTLLLKPIFPYEMSFYQNPINIAIWQYIAIHSNAIRNTALTRIVSPLLRMYLKILALFRALYCWILFLLPFRFFCSALLLLSALFLHMSIFTHRKLKINSESIVKFIIKLRIKRIIKPRIKHSLWGALQFSVNRFHSYTCVNADSS